MATSADTRGPMEYAVSSQAQHWTFDGDAALLEVRERANALAVERVASLESVRAAGGMGPIAPRCLPLHSPAPGGPRKRPREGEGEAAADAPELLTAGEEAVIVDKYRAMILDSWVAMLPPLRRSEKIGATAVVLFSRFFVSNSPMEFDPVVMGLASVLVASKAEGTWGYVPALHLPTATAGGGVGGGAVARVGRDESITETVPLLARPGDAFGLISSATAPPGGFFCVTEDTVEAAEATRAKVLAGELALLEGTGFHLLLHHPFAPLRGMVAALFPAAEGRALATALAQPSAPLSVPSVTSSSGAVGSAIDALGEAPLAARVLGAASAELRQCLASDLPLLFAPSHLALGALLLALEDHRSPALSSPAVQLAALRSGLDGSTKVLGARSLAKVEACRERIRALRAKPKVKAKHAKLRACALWR